MQCEGGPLDNRINKETAIVARTPLLQFLKILSSDVSLCQSRNISVAELMAERLAAPSRRQFVSGAAAMATSAALPEAAFAAPSKARIAIVGAGIAGLNAALTLQDAGIASTVYEASNRIGGRMFSATSIWADNQVSEWCGELIDSDHETIIGLARRFGLPLEDFAGNPSLRDTYKILGRYYTVEQAYEDWRGGVQQAIAKDLEAAGESTTYNKSTPEGRKLDQMSVAEWIDSRVPGGRKSPIGALLDVAYAIEYGADTTRPERAEHRLSARRQQADRGRRGVQRLRGLGRALSHPRRQPAAPGADRQASPHPRATRDAHDVDRPQRRRRLMRSASTAILRSRPIL